MNLLALTLLHFGLKLQPEGSSAFVEHIDSRYFSLGPAIPVNVRQICMVQLATELQLHFSLY